jgi:DNA-binding transcriptional LysR family regulator
VIFWKLEILLSEISLLKYLIRKSACPIMCAASLLMSVPMKRYFDPTTLRLFIAVCEEGNLARASEREAIVPSAVCKRIGTLEDDLQVRLLVRGKQGMRPTPAGLAFVSQARDILAGMERLHAEMSEFAGGVSGSVRIVASPAAISAWLPADVAGFVSMHHSVRVALKESLSSEIVRSVREGSADLGVCWDASDLSGLDVVKYRVDHPCVILQPSHPLAKRKELYFEETLEYDSVSVSPGSMMEIMLRRHAAIAGKTLVHRVEASTFDSACRIVAAGLGLAISPWEAVEPTVRALGLRMVPLQDNWARRQFVICSRSSRYTSSTAHIMADHLHRLANGDKQSEDVNFSTLSE